LLFRHTIGAAHADERLEDKMQRGVGSGGARTLRGGHVDIQARVIKLTQELIDIESRITSALDEVEAVAAGIDDGVSALLPELDLSAVPTILEVVRDLPADIRKDPRNACYFDKLETILLALGG
jgi:hypothetical protein